MPSGKFSTALSEGGWEILELLASVVEGKKSPPQPAGGPISDLASVKHASFFVDVNVLAYDPRDHFDFAYLPEGWQRVNARLGTKSLRDFALAAHAIGDFYAHSLWGYYMFDPKNGSIPVYDKSKTPAIDNGFIFDSYPPPSKGGNRLLY